MSNSIRQAALHYVERGFSVIPVEPRGKKPLVAWEQYQTRAAPVDEIKNLFRTPGANLAIVTGKISGLVVIDIDTEAAKEKLKKFVGDYDLDAVPRTRTGRGWQLFFAHSGTPIQNRAAVLPGLDVRGDGGYVVVPPSIHPNGRQYRWEVPLGNEIPKLPAELFKLITQLPEQQYRIRFNTAEALSGVEQGRRDETVFKLACKLRNADVPQDIAAELILEAARNCEPPFSERIAVEKVNRAYQKFQPKQQTSKEPEFWPEFISAKELLSLPPDPTRWVWDQTLPFGGGSVSVSKPKVGKTTKAANLSIAIARGLPFLGRDTIQCPVAYLSLDASLPEIAEVFTRLGLQEKDPVYIHAGSAPRDAIAWLVQRIREKGVRFVVVDTLQRLFRFENLNDYSEVSNTLEPLLEAVRDQNAHVMFLHHAKKDAGDDLDSAIGSTAIRGLAYTYLHLKRLPNSERRILRSDQRGGKNISEMALGFDRVTGWLQVQGTMEDVEVEEAKPKIAEFLKSAEGGEATEKEIRNSVPIRTLIASKALREMLRAGDVERTGEGKKGRPFRYSLSATLMDHSEDSCSRMGGIRGEGFGNENRENSKTPCGDYENSSSQKTGTGREQAGTRIRKADVRERESEGNWEIEL